MKGRTARPSIGAMATRPFQDRRQAGRQLAERLAPLGRARPVIVALPRGGVPVAYEVARALHAPLDVLAVRKIGAPGNPELGMGAVAEGGFRIVNDAVSASLLAGPEELTVAIERAERELEQRAARYRAGRPARDVEGRTVVLVDDGLATGGTARAAAAALRARHPLHIVLAVPVGSAEAIRELEPDFDEIVCLNVPRPMWAIGSHYEAFGQTSDEEVAVLLAHADAALGGRPDAAGVPPAATTPVSERAVEIPAGGVLIAGDLVVPAGARGLVVFAHGSGSGRHSPRNREVARALRRGGLATLLIDLLTPEEERFRSNVFDVALLAERLVAATAWARADADVGGLPIGLFGASTGAGAALWAAAEIPGEVAAVVSRGGRPDLAARRLAEVRAPTLLIVGGDDEVVVELNRDAAALLTGCEVELRIVPGATHLFEEPGTLEAVEELAGAWFSQHLAGTRAGG